MKRSAHLLITKVHNNSVSVLESVKVVLLLDSKISSPDNPIELKKEEVIFLIEDGDIIKTAVKDTATGSWNIGSKVNVITVNGKKYLRTDSNSTAQDNLDKLPQF
jgi:flagellar hook assembly protein FlgD